MLKPEVDEVRSPEEIDSFIKTSLRHIRDDYFRRLKKARKNDLEAIYQYKQRAVAIDPRYVFYVGQTAIEIYDYCLGESLKRLDELRREIFMLHVLYDKNDTNVADYLHMKRSTVNRKRREARELLYIWMEEMRNEKI